MLHLLRAKQDLFDTFAPSIRALPDLPGGQRFTKPELLTPEFRLHQDEKLGVYYAPFDYVNQDAKVALVGITPGWTQKEIAYRNASRDLRKGIAPGEVCRRAKQRASFAGSMRKNLVSMLNDLGLPAYLGIESTESLFAEHGSLLHTTSAIRYPVFVKDHNYTGHSPKLLKTDLLRYFVETVLARELQLAHEALIIPLGKSVSEALDHLASAGQLGRDRCLLGFPQPSGANGHRLSEFQERRECLGHQLQEWFGWPSRIEGGSCSATISYLHPAYFFA